MFDIDQKFQIEIPNRGQISLGPKEHLASGGEGFIYKKSNLVIKIYQEATHILQNRIPDKIRFLSGIKHPSIIIPEALALDMNGRAIGYVMPYVDGWALPLAFTNEWRDANKFTDANAISFIIKMKEVVEFAHKNKIILGDANELNILGVKGDPRYIDVDSWLPPGFSGDKVLPTIFDYHNQPFSQQADWFAWAVVSFQTLTGTHPYRGTHPDFKRADLEGRMRANVSVFRPEIRLSPAVRSFSRIPVSLLDWYRDVFEKGLRTPPPNPSAVNFMPMMTKRAKSANLITTPVYSFNGQFVQYLGQDIFLSQDGNLNSLPDGRVFANTGSVVLNRTNGVLLAGIVRQFGSNPSTIHYASVSGQSIEFQNSNIAGQKIWSADNRLFAVVPDGIQELLTRQLGGKGVLMTGQKWSLNTNTAFWGANIVVFDALTAKYLAVPFGGNSVGIIRIKELDGFKVMSLVRQGQIAVMSVITKSASYKRIVIAFTQDYTGYDIQIQDTLDGSLSDVVTESGVVVRFDDNGMLELTMPLTGAKKEADPGELSAGRLIAGASGVFCLYNGQMLKLSLA